MKHKNKKFIIPLPTLIFLLFAFAFLKDPLFFPTFVFAFCHELGHIFGAAICSVKLSKMTLYPFGADIQLHSGLVSYKKELFIYLSGPFVNLLLFAILKYFKAPSIYADINLVFGCMNLLPIISLDGGNALRTFLTLFFSPEVSAKVLKILSLITLLLLWAVASYLLMMMGSDPSLFIIVCILFSTIFLKKERC